MPAPLAEETSALQSATDIFSFAPRPKHPILPPNLTTFLKITFNQKANHTVGVNNILRTRRDRLPAAPPPPLQSLPVRQSTEEKEEGEEPKNRKETYRRELLVSVDHSQSTPTVDTRAKKLAPESF